MALSRPGPPRTPAVISVVAFLTLVGLGFLALVGGWVIFKLTQPDQRMDIAEWPFAIVGAVVAIVPLWAAIRLATGRGGRGLALVIAVFIGVIGALALAFAIGFLSMGVAWNLLIGGGVMLAGAIWTVFVVRRPLTD